MKTRRIAGTDIQAALREVRRTLGADAVIISTRETGEGIEIVAAAPPAQSQPPAAAKRRRAEVLAQAQARIQAGTRRAAAAPAQRPEAPRPARQVRPGLASLVAGIARPAGAGAAHGAVVSELDAVGLAADVRDGILAALAGRDTRDARAAAGQALSARIRVEGGTLMTQGGRVAMLGGTGVGKTTTIAKLAAHFARRHGAAQVALVNADQHRIGASDQLRRFGQLIGVPTYEVRNAAELSRTLATLSATRLVLVDTAGISETDVRFAEQARMLLGAGLEGYLALSLNTQAAVLARSVRAYSGLKLRALVLTKEDEAMSLGAGLSMAVRHRLPVSYVTTGPAVPADIRLASADKLTARAFALAAQARDEAGAATAEAAR